MRRSAVIEMVRLISLAKGSMDDDLPNDALSYIDTEYSDDLKLQQSVYAAFPCSNFPHSLRCHEPFLVFECMRTRQLPLAGASFLPRIDYIP